MRFVLKSTSVLEMICFKSNKSLQRELCCCGLQHQNCKLSEKLVICAALNLIPGMCLSSPPPHKHVICLYTLQAEQVSQDHISPK